MKRYISLLMIGLMVFTMTASVSCDRDKTPVSPVKEKNESEEIQAKVEQMQKDYEFFMAVVDKVEPYVTTNKDHTWTVDWEGFEAANSDLTAKEAKIVSNLKKGLPLANKAVSEALKAPAQEESVWTNYYWWGKKTCFTGTQALDYAYWFDTLTYGGFYFGGIPGLILKGYAGVCKWLAQGCGGYCFNQSWFGGIWVTCP